MWSIDTTLVDSWLDMLDDDSADQVLAALTILRDVGPALGRPLVDAVASSRHRNMKQFRPGSKGRTRVRIVGKAFEERLASLTPERRANVEAHRQRMLAEVRAYRLRELREQRLLSQNELAQRINVSQRRVSGIETGNIEKTQVETLRRYAEAIGGTLRVEVELDGDRFQVA